jgi:lipid-A-disaccharide synthase-like uncharacterized protein
MNDLALLSLPYTAVSFSIIARFIFMYLLYSKTSTNVYSLTFCYLSVISASFWIPYGVIIEDRPIVVSSIEILLLSLSAAYIHYNRMKRNDRILPMIHNNSCETAST